MAWIEFQSAIYEGDGGIDISLEVTKHRGNLVENVRIITANPKRAPSIFDALLTAPFRVVAPSIQVKPNVAMGAERESRRIMWITFEVLPERIESALHSQFFPGHCTRSCSKKKVIRSEIVRSPL